MTEKSKEQSNQQHSTSEKESKTKEVSATTKKGKKPPKNGSTTEEKEKEAAEITDDRAERDECKELLTNYYNTIVTKGGHEKRYPNGYQIKDIFEKVQRHVGDWPKRVGEAIYMVHAGKVRHLDKSPRLFSWLMALGCLPDWIERCPTAISKAQFFEYVLLSSTPYRAIETIPHHPFLPNTYYALEKIMKRTYGTFKQLLAFFSPATEQDAAYLMAMFMTPCYGGPGGSRPAFVLLGPEDDPDGGRGVGKTAVTDIMAILYGTCIDFNAEIDRDSVTKRLLTSDSPRLIRIDNIKNRLSNADLESLITSQYISGHKLYTGDHSIPNLFTWLLTYNQPDFSKDLAQRAIPIRLKRPDYHPQWWDRVSKFAEEHRANIIQDIVDLLKRPAAIVLEAHFRFAGWSESVLSRCTTDTAITRDLLVRQADTDEEEDLMDQIKDTIEAHLDLYLYNKGLNGESKFRAGVHDNLKYMPGYDRCRIKLSLVVDWLRDDLRWMTARKLKKLLLDHRPDWLNVSGGKGELCPRWNGYQMLDFGNKNVQTPWIIEKQVQQIQFVTDTLSLKNREKSEKIHPV